MNRPPSSTSLDGPSFSNGSPSYSGYLGDNETMPFDDSPLYAELTRMNLVRTTRSLRDNFAVQSMGFYPVLIEGNWLVGRLVQQMNATDPLWPLVSPVPPTLLEQLEAEIGTMMNHRIQPYFVFHGIDVHASRESPMDVARYAQRRSMWAALHSRASQDFRNCLGEVSIGRDVEGCIIRHLQSLKIGVMLAPYYSWPQIAALIQNRAFVGVYGPPEVLVAHVSVVFLRITKTEIKFVVRQEIPRVQRQQGTEELKIMDMLLRSNRPSTTLAHLLEETASRRHQSPGECLRANLNCPVMTRRLHGLVSYDDILTDQVPNVPRKYAGADVVKPTLYFLMSVGLLSPDILYAIIRHCFYTPEPIVDTFEIRNAISRMALLRIQSYIQLAKVSGLPMNHRMNVRSWFDGPQGPNADHDVTINSCMHFITLEHWKLHANVDDGRPELHLLDALNVALQSTCDGTKTMYYTVKQVLYATYLRSLDFLGYFSHLDEPRVGLTPFCGAIRSLLEHSQEFGVEYMIAVELLRTEILSWHAWTYPRPHSTDSTDDDGKVDRDIDGPESAEVAILSRLACIVHVPLRRGCGWGLHIDRRLTAFAEMAREVHKALRQLFECICVALYLEPSTHLPLQEFAHIAPLLPFRQPTSSIGGLIMKDFLQAKEFTNAWVEKYDAVEDIHAQIEKLCRFCHRAMRLSTDPELTHSSSSEIENVCEEAQGLLGSQLRKWVEYKLKKV